MSDDLDYSGNRELSEEEKGAKHLAVAFYLLMSDLFQGTNLFLPWYVRIKDLLEKETELSRDIDEMFQFVMKEGYSDKS